MCLFSWEFHTLMLTHWGLNKMNTILQTNSFYCMKIVLFLIQFKSNFSMNAPLTEKSTLVQVMAWCWRGAKPFPEPMLTQILSPYHDMASPGHNELRENNSPIIYATEFNFVTHCASTLKIFSLQFIVCFFHSSQQNKDIVLHHFKITITVFVSKSAYLIEQQIKIQINQVYLTGSRCLLATWSHEHAGWLTGHLLSRLQPIYSLRVDAWPTEHVTVYTKKSGEPFLQCF